MTDMILDDLFKKAAADYKPNGPTPTVMVVVTENQTGGFASVGTNIGSATGQITLAYSPGKVITGRIFPPQFSNAAPKQPVQITISAPIPTAPKPSYEVGILAKGFVPQVDATTNIVYGAAGSVFVTISICGYYSGGPN
jgi:hypothetical protein